MNSGLICPVLYMWIMLLSTLWYEEVARYRSISSNKWRKNDRLRILPFAIFNESVADITTRHDEPYDGNGQIHQFIGSTGDKETHVRVGSFSQQNSDGKFYKPLTWYLQQSKRKKKR